MAASTHDPEEIPDWLVIGLELPLWLETDAPGQTPDQTSLYEEGCAEVGAVNLLEVGHAIRWCGSTHGKKKA